MNKVFDILEKGDIIMSYIRAIVPMDDYRLFMDMESGSVLIVNLSIKLNTMKYKALADEGLFRSAKTDGDYVVWGDGKVRLTAKELLDVVLLGEYTKQS